MWGASGGLGSCGPRSSATSQIQAANLFTLSHIPSLYDSDGVTVSTLRGSRVIFPLDGEPEAW